MLLHPEPNWMAPAAQACLLCRVRVMQVGDQLYRYSILEDRMQEHKTHWEEQVYFQSYFELVARRIGEEL
jgi:hypothetical protein